MMRLLLTVLGELRIAWRILRHPRAPFISKFLIIVAIAYIVFPTDFVYDLIPALGQMDDLVVAFGLLSLAKNRIPPDVLTELNNG